MLEISSATRKILLLLLTHLNVFKEGTLCGSVYLFSHHVDLFIDIRGELYVKNAKAEII